MSHQHETVVNHHQSQCNGHADIGLAPMHPDSQRNADKREPETGELKRDLPVHRHPDWFNQIIPLLFKFPQLRSSIRR